MCALCGHALVPHTDASKIVPSIAVTGHNSFRVCPRREVIAHHNLKLSISLVETFDLLEMQMGTAPWDSICCKEQQWRGRGARTLAYSIL